LRDFAPFTSVKLVQNLWAGVEDVVTNPTLTQPLARMVDAGLTDGMVEWCTGHVLRHHLGMDAHIGRTDGVWDPVAPPLAQDRIVTVLGLGALGQAVCEALVALKFEVRGWSRSPRDVDGAQCHAGEAGLAAALEGTDILVLLLPQTSVTENLLNRDRIALLAKDGVVINPGRGPLIDDAALIAALDAGHLAHATLDVFRTEPLPPDHAFWAHPKVTVTPHIASATRPSSAARVIAENVRRGEVGEPFLHLVDRARGY
ncbi:MAG: NAD(P)-dependent oxidoreductase, partial [Paracoccaceae bacterium]|nr:NAD(P)-dependent oxidoreductase [Paracoccaceae bacterium]